MTTTAPSPPRSHPRCYPRCYPRSHPRCYPVVILVIPVVIPVVSLVVPVAIPVILLPRRLGAPRPPEFAVGPQSREAPGSAASPATQNGGLRGWDRVGWRWAGKTLLEAWRCFKFQDDSYVTLLFSV